MTQVNVFELLAAPGPWAHEEDSLRLHGQFVGSWDIEGTWYQPDGSSRTGRGEWHFAWILGGRGIQDVLYASGAPRHEFGTTLRCYDGSIDAWRLSWMQPASGEFVNLIGRYVGDRIVAETVDSDPPRRWSFTDITPESFVWLGEVSHDQGKTWFLEQQMRAVRRKAPPAEAP
jgi:hypothetical protein